VFFVAREFLSITFNVDAARLITEPRFRIGAPRRFFIRNTIAEGPMKKKWRINFSEAGEVDRNSVQREIEPHWGRIEDAYGRPLDSKLRDEIVTLVWDLWNDAALEQNAPMSRDVLNRIAEIRRGALDFKLLLNKLPDETERYIRNHLQQEIKRLGPPQADMRTTVQIAGRLVTACDRVSQRLRHSEGFVDGDAWRHFIIRLTNILKNAKLPTGAAQSRDKSKGDGVSPFVSLVIALQSTLPKKFRRHDRADPLSLGKEINRARQPIRDKVVPMLSPTMSRAADSGHELTAK
jgi:hypothetical protein